MSLDLICLLWTFLTNGIIWYMTFCVTLCFSVMPFVLHFDLWINVFRVYPCCSMCHNLIPFYDWIIFRYVFIPGFVYPFICCWTFGLFSPFGYCEKKNFYIYFFQDILRISLTKKRLNNLVGLFSSYLVHRTNNHSPRPY